MDLAHWQGQLWLQRDFCLLAGASGDTQPHAHYAHQAMLALQDPLRLLIDGRPVSERFVLVESLCPHAFVEPGQPLLALYAEPLAFSAATLRGVLGDVPTEPQALLARLQQAPRQPLDERVAQALQAVDELLQDRLGAASLAQQVCLSLSQLERLFGVQVGLSVRRLVLWRRLRLALLLSWSGSSLTEAAHAAGFADSAHFSRTVRSMFGVQAQSLRHLRLVD
ncbi:helix-turn-helix domain-containing protein [Pseudomonas sp. Gutcm_11s]|uniref:helix-turn-helix domain-containing protein n=1 Tax=Pseudomonas sp. Gutcm_11s TaxID=3026088 RepID=UPI00235E4820|nr:AraC family transcriptional regulator [Pseudomonas sp. Gutcm_11s]MDD0841796.1 AraC family transcriptional regulator [Pseudomonas sp. Gutcm_11s]